MPIAGRSLISRLVCFPMAGPKDGWARLVKNLKVEIDEALIEAYRATVSLPFEAGEHRRVVVKIADDRNIESLKFIGGVESPYRKSGPLNKTSKRPIDI